MGGSDFFCRCVGLGKKCPSLKRIPGAVHSLLAYPANVFRDYDSFQKREQSSFTTSQTWALPSPALLGVGEPLLLGLLFSQRQGWGRSLDDPRTASLCCGSLRMGPRLRDEGYPPLPATWGTEATHTGTTAADIKHFPRCVAYVMQDDVLMPRLTV